MKVIGAFVIATLCSSIYAQPGGKDSDSKVPSKIKTGTDTLKKTPEENARTVSAQIRQMSEERKDAILAQALRTQIELYQRILPQWCRQIPASILIYVDFSVEDSDLERGLKYMRLALFVRDMYQEFPINRDVFITLDPLQQRIENKARYRLVALAFLQAYELFKAHHDELDTDLMLSMADFGNWALHYFEMAGDDQGVQAVEMALAMNDVARRAVQNMQLAPVERSHFERLSASSLGLIAKNLAPIIWLALMSSNWQSAKSLSK